MERVKPRRELPKIKVSASPAEREAIVAAAASVGLSTAAYLRQVGTAYRPESIVNLDQVDAMLKLSQDTKGLGYLLKWWLTDDPRLANFAHIDMPTVILRAVAAIDKLHAEMRFVTATVIKTRV